MRSEAGGMRTTIRVVSAWICMMWILSASEARGREDPFALSPPVMTRPNEYGARIATNLRDLQDASGLAWLFEDRKAARILGDLIGKWKEEYTWTLKHDRGLIEMNARIDDFYHQLLEDRRRSHRELSVLIRSFPRTKLKPVLEGWLRNLLYRQDIGFRRDLKGLDEGQCRHLCKQARSIHTLEGLPANQVRMLAWWYRDTEIRKLTSEVDKRIETLTPIALRRDSRDDDEIADTLDRYLGMLHHLKLRLMQERTLPYEKYRTLSGLLAGLRYMDTIVHACRLTGLNPHTMISLFIQESGFIHQRVSVAGAFSVAQFMSIALKDVWSFRDRIEGSVQLLKGIDSLEELKRSVRQDPRVAIRVSCLYFRRLRDEVAVRMQQHGGEANNYLQNLIAIEMRAWHKGLFETTRDEDLFEKQMDRLYDVLGLGAYNAGMGNLIKTGKKKVPWAALGFPLQIYETRNYVDGILDGIEFIDRVQHTLSEISRINYSGLKKLFDGLCRRADMIGF